MSTTRGHTGGPAATSVARTLTRLAACLTLVAAAPAGAQMMNTTLTFENVPGSAAAGGVRRVNNCLVESGVRVTVLEQVGGGNSALQALPCETGTPTPSTPTALAMYAPGNGSFLGNAIFNDVGSAIDFTPVAGGPFALFSLDLASYDLLQVGTMPVTFTGFRLGGGMNAMQTFELSLSTRAFTTVALTGFTNLSSARVTFGAPLFGAQVDNVRVGVVPEPSTYLLMATGLVTLGAMARRRRRANTPS
jgi:hypothetical protein